MPTDIQAFLARYDTWDEARTKLSEQEESGTFPTASQWEGSDDTAVELLHEAAALLEQLP